MILCDTGPLVAAFNEADRDHVRCVRFLQENWPR
jgi:predicted nucleic acid-binding protein